MSTIDTIFIVIIVALIDVKLPRRLEEDYEIFQEMFAIVQFDKCLCYVVAKI